MARSGPPKPLGLLLPPGLVSGQEGSPAPSTNARYQQLKKSGPRYSRPRSSRSAARQKALFRLDNVGAAINARAPFPDELAYITTFLINATLPLEDPPTGTRLWTRHFDDKRGRVQVIFEAGSEPTPDGGERCFGLPYGIYPRILLAWIISEALTTKSRVLTLATPDPLADKRLPRSFSAWMRDALGVVPKGGQKGSITLLRKQMTRLFNLKITVTINGKESRFRVLPIKGDTGFFDPNLDHGARLTKPLQLILDEDFFIEILKTSSPTHLTVQKELAALGACLSLDLYRFLTLKQYALLMSQARVPELISWERLEGMFGHANKHKRNFRSAIVAALELLDPLYPDHNAEPCPGGLRIRPSKPHITPEPKSPRTIAAASKAALERAGQPTLPPASRDADDAS
jgi:hypothetical protein